MSLVSIILPIAQIIRRGYIGFLKGKLFWRNTGSFGKCTDEVSIGIKTGKVCRFCDGNPAFQKSHSLGYSEADKIFLE